MKEKLDELLSDFKGRIKNPLVLSFILVWLFKHWLLLYWIFTVDSQISVYKRTSKIIEYLKFKGIFDLTLWPLFLAFISLALYYLIANLAQVIQIFFGKRLNIIVTKRSDTSKLVLRTELERESQKYKDIKKLLNGAEEEIEKLNSEIREYQEAYSKENEEHMKTNDELVLVKSNIDYNIRFKERIKLPLISLLGKANNIEVKGSQNNTINENYELIRGSWSINIFETINSKSYETRSVNIKGKIVKYFDGKEYGEISNFEYDTNHFILKFSIVRVNGVQGILQSGIYTENYILIQINTDLYQGLIGNSCVEISRRNM